MAFVSGCDHDVFISYSRANNHADWVTRFHKQLEARLRERVSAEIDVFRDPELSGNQGLTDELKRRLRSSAVVVAVVSRSYLQRPWCQLEIDEFRKAAGQRGVTGCIFPVRYDDVRPAEFQHLLGNDFLGYEFCGPVDDSGPVVEFAADNEPFKRALLKLRNEIAGQLEQLQSRAAPSPSEDQRQGLLPTAALSDRPVVFLAEPPRALAAQRDELAAFLKEGFGMDTIQPGANFHERDGYAEWYTGELGRADLFVQLLGRQFEPHDDEAIHSWDRWQHQQAVAAGRPIQRWFNKFDKQGHPLDLQDLDANQRQFVTESGVWDHDFKKFKDRVRDEVQRLALDRRQRSRASQSGGAKPLVVIRSDKSDKAFVKELEATLQQLNCEAVRVPDKDIASLDEYAREFPANGLLLVYRECPGRWVLKRLQELRSFLCTELGRRWACGLWNQPQDEEDPISCRLDGILVIDPRDERTLQTFVAELRRLGVATEVTP
ncbi:MAG: TIR domain-containing protein [Planctomycetota bacterium]|nr:TIR domain-containing protein [Planctomycetota bacterium]